MSIRSTSLFYLLLFIGMMSGPNAARADDAAEKKAVGQAFSMMEVTARQRAGTKHPLSNIELVERSGTSVASNGTGVDISADYAVHMKGAIMGRDKFLVTVRVTSKVVEKDGVYVAEVTGSTVISDSKK